MNNIAKFAELVANTLRISNVARTFGHPSEAELSLVSSLAPTLQVLLDDELKDVEHDIDLVEFKNNGEYLDFNCYFMSYGDLPDYLDIKLTLTFVNKPSDVHYYVTAASRNEDGDTRHAYRELSTEELRSNPHAIRIALDCIASDSREDEE